jgi:transcription initiation factor IIE alpha subunit
VNSNTVIYEVRKAEEIFQTLVSRSNGRGACGCTLKELAEQVGLTVRELHQKLRLLRSCRIIHTFRCRDGYAFFLNDPPRG